MEKYVVMRKIYYRKEKRTIGYIMWSHTSIICVDRARISWQRISRGWKSRKNKWNKCNSKT